MRTGAVQCDTVWEDASADRAKLPERITTVAREGARRKLLPETFATVFSTATERFGEAADGPTATSLSEQTTAHDTWVGGSFACRVDRSHKPTNRFLFAAPDGSPSPCDKVRPFTPRRLVGPLHQGDRLVIVAVEALRVMLFVGFNPRLADWFWRDATIPTATSSSRTGRRLHSPAGRTFGEHGPARTGAYVVGMNRVGVGNDVVYVGPSAVHGPFGTSSPKPGLAKRRSASRSTRTVAETLSCYPFLEDRWVIVIAPQQFAMKFGVFRPLLAVMGLGPRFAGVTLDGDRMIVKMGWAFRAELSRSAIASAARTRGLVGGIGVHGWRGRWLVNGAASGLVMVRFDPDQRARVVGYPVQLRALCLSLEEPDRFVSQIAPTS